MRILNIPAALLAVALCAAPAASSELPHVSDPGFMAFLPSFIEGTERFMNGDTALWKEHASHADDAMILGAWGAWEKGWPAVSARYDRAGASFRDAGAELDVEFLSVVMGGDLVIATAVERATVLLAGQDEPAPMALRVTQAFRKEDGEWKLILRHADPLIERTAPQAVLRAPRGGR